ncbi:hypothetical protein BBJ28_00022667 [Nothophytophthora sp. Chile5]|nr:hypothetical protein BBJ28_00022667 [Nothophytophthora sp. Chile5]
MASSHVSGRSRSPPQSRGEADHAPSEGSPLLAAGAISLNYNSDSAVYDREDVGSNGSRRFFETRGGGNAPPSSGDEDEQEDYSDLDRQFSPASYRQQAPSDFQSAKLIPRANWRGLGAPSGGSSRFKRGAPMPLPPPGAVSHTTRRSRMRTIKKQLREPPSAPKLRVSAYCTCDQLLLFKLLKWLERVETGQLPGGELHPDGWRHKMYMGAIHSSCAPGPDHTYGAVTPPAVTSPRLAVGPEG